MERARYDIGFTRGDDYSVTFTFKDNQATPQPLYWVGMTFTAQLRRTYDDTDVINFVVDDAGLAFGVLKLSLAKETTATLGGGYVWDLDMLDGATNRGTLVFGSVFVNLDVTRESVPAAGPGWDLGPWDLGGWDS